MTTSREEKLAYAAWIAVCLIWGTTYLAIKIGLETIPPALMGGIRFAIAGVILALLLRAWGIPLPPRASWPGNVTIAFLLLGLGNGFVMWGEQWVPSGLTAVLLATAPFWMVGIEACLSSGERLTPRHVAGLLLGFVGILLLVWPDLTVRGAASSGFVAGFISLQIACLGWSLGSAYSRRHARGDHALAAAAMQMFAGGMMMLVAGTLLGEWPRLAFTPRTLAAFLYLIFIGAIGGFGAYIYALKYLPVATVSLYSYINPIIAVILGALILGESLSARMAFAILVILAGVALVRSAPARSRAREESPAAA